MSWIVTARYVLFRLHQSPVRPLPPQNKHTSEWALLEGIADEETVWLPSYLLFMEQLKDPYRFYSGRSVPFEK